MPLVFWRRSTNPFKKEIDDIWEIHKHKLRNTVAFAQPFASIVIAEVEEILFHETDNHSRIMICTALLSRVVKTIASIDKKERNKDILAKLIMLMAQYNVDDRDLVRKILCILFCYDKYITREVFLFQHFLTEDTRFLSTETRIELRKKQEYILSHVAGWKLPSDIPWDTYPSIDYYIELPFRRVNVPANSHLMAEALYRQHDPEFVLLLLRHGMHPSCLYLWPICILLDLKYTIVADTDTIHQEEMRASDEARMVRYFCRARHFVHVHMVHSHQRDMHIASLPPDVAYDDILLVSPQAKSIIPPERQSEPAELMHQCRLSIRKALLLADCLPHGIEELPIPKCLFPYIDLLVD